MQLSLSVKNLDKLQAAMRASPQKIAREIQSFLARSGAKLRSTVQNDPWRVGQSGGGAPVDTGTLRNSHRQRIDNLSLTLRPDTKYARYVHDGTDKMKARPWLAYALQKNEKSIQKQANQMAERIIKGLAV